MPTKGKPIQVKWTEQLILLKAEVAALPPGPERDAAMARAKQLENAIQMEGWIQSQGLQPPK